MTTGKPLHLVLLWHMHQPDFRDAATGDYRLPWVYLHALKDYTDMAAHLERHPTVRAVVNFVPILLDQIEDYSDQFASGRLRDPLLRALAGDQPGTTSPEERALTLDRCFRAHHEKMVDPFPAYRRLLDLFRFVDELGGDSLDYLSSQYYADLLTWYHLAWTGETIRRSRPEVVQLMSKGQGFSLDDRRLLLAVIGDTVREVLPRWRRLAQRGQIELSSTPHYHPLAPLLLDFGAAREAQPDAPQPRAAHYPGGAERLADHLHSAIDSHRRRFGAEPAGLWPAEGAVSDAFLRLLPAHGIRWTATGAAVLANSLAASAPLPPANEWLYRGYRLSGGDLVGFFRDDHLSDLIGFEYSRWPGDAAAAAFVDELERIAAAAPESTTPLVSVILDGENAWEYYPYNGFYFLDGLYSALAAHPAIRTMTYSEHLAAVSPAAHENLDHVVAGSWVYGNLSTWIGDHDKNAAWDLLCEAKRCFDLVTRSGQLDAAELELATRQLAVCEGSDWTWWFGDYNPPASVMAMDQVYRANLSHLYRLLELEPPSSLDTPVSRGGTAGESTGAMRRAS